MNSNIISSSSITGQKVHNLNNENIGSIKDLMMDPKTGEILYAVMTFGGFLGMGEKYFAVPINAMQFSHKDETIILDADKEKLENTPSFDKDHWPKTADQEFITSVYGHYGLTYRRDPVA